MLPVVKWTPSLVSTAFVISFTMLGLSLIRIAEVVLDVCSWDCLVVVLGWLEEEVLIAASLLRIALVTERVQDESTAERV